MRISVLFLILAGAAGAVLAQTAEVETTPAEAFAKAIDARGEPAPEHAFDFQGGVFMGEERLGTFRFSAAIVEEEGEKLYRLQDRGRMSAGGRTFAADTETWLDRRLVTLRGEEVRDDDGVKSSARWSRTEAGYRILEKRGDAEEEEKAVAAPGGLISNVSGTLLFARGLPAEAGTYAFRSLNVLNPDGGDVEEILLTAQGVKEWNGADALVFHRRKGDRDITFALDPESRDFLGMRMEGADGTTIDFRPGAAAEPSDGLAPPAKDAKQCALIAALAYGTGNGALLASLCDWESILEDIRRKHPDREYELETLRQGVIDSLDDYQGAQPRETVAPVILAIADQVTVTGDADRATVVFPPLFENLTIHVARFGDEWRIVALPGT